MRNLFIFALVLVGVSAAAQVPSQPENTDPSQADLRILNQDGSLVSIRMEPNGPLSFYVVGREEAAIDFSQLQIVVRSLSEGTQKVLNSHLEGNRVIVDEPLDLTLPTDFEVTAGTPKKMETFHFEGSRGQIAF